MKKDTWMRGALALAVMLGASPALAADHLDGPGAKADPTEDITDLFTWMDGGNVVLILNLWPNSTTTTKFSNTVQYVFHTESFTAYPPASPKPVDVICTFDATQKISCWVGTADYVTGDAGVTGGITSKSGDVKVFAGLRDDPFFFNVGGFVDAATDFGAAASSLTFGADGCPAVDATTSAKLLGDLGHTMHGAMPAVDTFSPSAGYSGNVLAIVLSIKSSLLTAGGPLMSVWASTNKGM